MKYLLVIAIISCALVGCDFMSREVDIQAVRQQLEMRKGDVQQLKIAADSLSVMAQQSGNQTIIDAAVAAQTALAEAQAYIPKLETELKRLEEQGSASVWQLGLAALWPLATSMLKYLPGPFGAVGNIVAEVAFRMNATRAARIKDEEAHNLLAVSTTKVTK